MAKTRPARAPSSPRIGRDTGDAGPGAAGVQVYPESFRQVISCRDRWLRLARQSCQAGHQPGPVSGAEGRVRPAGAPVGLCLDAFALRPGSEAADRVNRVPGRLPGVSPGPGCTRPALPRQRPRCRPTLIPAKRDRVASAATAHACRPPTWPWRAFDGGHAGSSRGCANRARSSGGENNLTRAS